MIEMIVIVVTQMIHNYISKIEKLPYILYSKSMCFIHYVYVVDNSNDPIWFKLMFLFVFVIKNKYLFYNLISVNLVSTSKGIFVI